MTPEQATLIALRARQAETGTPASGERPKPKEAPRAGNTGQNGQKGKPDLRHFGVPHPRPDTVHIAMNVRTGDITFHPSILHVGHGRTVTWLYMNGGPFTIHFSGRSPFAGGRASLHSTDGKVVSPPLPRGAVGHRFRYGLAARVSHGEHGGKIAMGAGGVLAVSE